MVSEKCMLSFQEIAVTSIDSLNLSDIQVWKIYQPKNKNKNKF